MPRSLRLLIAFVATVGAVALVVATLAFPPFLRLSPEEFGFWLVIAVLASASPVRLPRGSIVGVSAAVMLTVAFLAGPGAAGLVAAIGSTEWRELRGRVPWFGTLFNHSALVIPSIAAGLAYWLTVGVAPFEPS